MTIKEHQLSKHAMSLAQPSPTVSPFSCAPPVTVLARRRERMILHAFAIQIRSELRVRLSLQAASDRLTPLTIS